LQKIFTFATTTKLKNIMKKIPIGIQAFSKLIEGDFVYLDKTDMIYNIANTSLILSKTFTTVIAKAL